MRLLLPALLLMASPAVARDSLGQFGGWGAFRDGAHCYAIAEPNGKRTGASVAVSSSSSKGVVIQFHAHLRKAAAADRPVRLQVGDWSQALAAQGQDAWATSARADLRILAAIRSGDSLAVSAVDARGRRFTDHYVLAGAASAIDAAMIGCIAP